MTSTTSEVLDSDLVPVLDLATNVAWCPSQAELTEKIVDSHRSQAELAKVPTVDLFALPSCVRLVVGFGLEPDDPLPLLNVGVKPTGEVRVVLPPLALGAMAIDSNAVDTELAGTFAFVVTDPDGVSIRVRSEHSLRVQTSWWSEPERVLVLDLTTENPNTPAPRLISGDGAVNIVLVQPVPIDEPITLPLEMTGYSRLVFEGQGVVRMRTLAATPGGGELVPVTLAGRGVLAIATGEYAIQLNAWPDAWGEFRFTISALGPGRYELFVGDDIALGESDESEESGVYMIFSVAQP